MTRRRAFAGLVAAALIVVAVIGALLAVRSGLHQHALARPPSEISQSVDPKDAAHARSLRYSYIGASVTRGWYVTSLESGYPAVSAHMMAREERRDVDWRVVALPGAPIATVLTWPVPAGEDVVVIHVVSDDFLYGTPLDVYRTRYRELLDKVRAASPRAKIVCLGDWGKVGAVDREGLMAYQYDQIVHDACTAEAGVYVPINGDYDMPGSRGPIGHASLFGPAHGDFHPNDFGNKLIAESVVDGLNGNPPAEVVPPAATETAPAPRIPDPGPGSHPPKVGGHESHKT